MLNLVARTKVLVQLTFQLIASNWTHLLGPLDRIDAVCMSTSKDDVELLEASTLGLREEEVDAGNDGGVHDCKDDVCSVTDVGKGWGRDHDDEEVG